MTKIEAKVSTLPLNNLKEMAQMLFSDVRDGSEIVLSAVLDRLMVIMPESEFVAFCQELEG